MHIVAGTFTSRTEARCVLDDLTKIGISPESMSVIEVDDETGFDVEHRTTLAAAAKGAAVGAVCGAVVFGLFLKISGIDIFTLRFLALFVAAVVVDSGFTGTIFACWNMGVSHDEARLFDEARARGDVIAAVEVSQPMEERVMHELVGHGARNVRSGSWSPRGWKHSSPAFGMPA